MLDLDAIWKKYTESTGLYAERPDFRFDRNFYGTAFPDLIQAGLDLLSHFTKHGKSEGRPATLYQQIKRHTPRLDHSIADILIDGDLKTAVEEAQPDAAELAFELLILQGDIDEQIADFSHRHYVMQYPDIKDSGILPVVHYLQFGKKEKRSSLRTIRRNYYEGDQAYDPSKKTIIIAVHEFTKTGAPIVGLQLVQEAAETHNVYVLSLQSGQLLESFRKACTGVFVSFMPHQEIDFILKDQLVDVDYALMNSTDCAPFIPMLVARRIPFGVYVHEFTQYSLPLMKTIWPTFYADYMIYSSELVRDSWRGIQEDLGFDTEICSTIIPQAELKSGRVGRKVRQQARERIEKVLGIELGNRKLIYGAGSTHWRKGTDLFVLMAQIGNELDKDAVWVWIGDGMNHEDFHCGVWLEKQMVEANVNQKDGFFHHLPGGPYYKDLCIASDVMILPSRMDPLPNVILDAVKYDTEVVLFENASGYDDDSYNDEKKFHRVGYGRVDLAARKAVELPKKSEKRRGLSLDGILPQRESEETLFGKVSGALEKHLAKQTQYVLGKGAYDLPVLYTERPEDKLFREAERQKAWSLGRLTVWKSDEDARRKLVSTGHPVHKSSGILRYAEESMDDVPPFSIHIHAYYTDDLYHDVMSYGLYRRAEKVVITTDMVKKANAIHEIMKDIGVDAEVVRVDNKGRDILPFMELFHDIQQYSDTDVWAHVHQKKSFSSTPGGDVWRNFLLKILFGGEDYASNALRQMADSDVGLVAPFDPFICGWFGSKRILPIYQQLIKTEIPQHPILFPVGNMFWTRRKVVDQMNSYFGDDHPWPNEPIANDGTVFHLIERLWPTATYEAGLKSVFISKPDQPRR